MAYKDRERQRKAQHDSYQRHKERRMREQKEQRDERRRMVGEYKVGHGCNRCGYNRSARALDAHHPPGTKISTKKSAITHMCTQRMPWEVILAELEKCEILCANCHREHHDPAY